MHPITQELFQENLLVKTLKEKILLLDGAMGTMIQQENLTETDFRSNLFKNHAVDLNGNNDILSLTQPNIIKKIHRRFFEAGADIATTNTFNATAISQEDYDTVAYVYDINYEAAKLARLLADEWSQKTPDKPRFVAGSIGPTKKSASISPDISHPSYRNIDFDTLANSYYDQIRGLVDGGVHCLMIETIIDTLNLRAALWAADKVFQEQSLALPILTSCTLINTGGRLLSGQSLDAFVASIDSDYVISVGLNCSFGAKELIPFIEQLSKNQDLFISLHPNAGLPDEHGAYNESPQMTGYFIRPLVENQKVNIIGGCCGTTPEHISVLAELACHKIPRATLTVEKEATYAGLEFFPTTQHEGPISISNKANVHYNPEFLEALQDEDDDTAIDIIMDAIDEGAEIININVSHPSLEATHTMDYFVKRIAAEPTICKSPLMLQGDSWAVVEAGLKSIQGKSIANVLTFKKNDPLFLNQAKSIKSLGDALVISLNPPGNNDLTLVQALNQVKKAYNQLVNIAKVYPENIIIDISHCSDAETLHRTIKQDYPKVLTLLANQSYSEKPCSDMVLIKD